jgi:hypothetical protein
MLSLLRVLIVLSSTLVSLAVNANDDVFVPQGKAPKLTGDGQKIFYELVSENIRPDQDEFYVVSIFGTNTNARALIKRSTNTRASELYTEAVSYGIGDEIAEDLFIESISFPMRELTVKRESTGEIFGLKLSYGDAVSRLIKRTN